MLLEFKTKNFKTFVDELVFSMTPAPKQKGLDYSLLREKIGSREYKGLSSAVIYGPNASGKTNIIGAMDVLKNIVFRGHILNGISNSRLNLAADHLELIPNRSARVGTPVDFEIMFIDQNMLFQYKLSLDLGKFLDEDYPRKILSEHLSINEKMIFSRNSTKELKVGDLKPIHKHLVVGYEGNESNLILLAKNNLNPTELFLMNGFKAMFSSSISDQIKQWFDSKFMVYFRADSLRSLPKSSGKSKIYFDPSMNKAAKIFGVYSNNVGYLTSDEDSDSNIVSLIEGEDGNVSLPSDVYESFGTIRFINMFPVIVRALLTGGTLVIDEFDASLHPMALMSIINTFHNDEINKNKAQLIFNTHNPIFLNSNLFRRDEIKFVERDEFTSTSTHYSLSDFGTAGRGGVRNGGEYMTNYFINRYGAIKDVDFTSVFEDIVEERGVLEADEANQKRE